MVEGIYAQDNYTITSMGSNMAASNTTDIPRGSPNDTGAISWSIPEKLAFGTWLTISMLCAIVGNLMVIIVVIRHKGMRTRTNMFLVNLAVADFLVGVLLMPFSLTTLIRDTWIFRDEMCNVNGFMNAVCLITSIHTLMYISIHKYVSITSPFSRILNNWKILAMISCAWLWAVICGVLTFVLNKIVYKPGALQCGPEYPHNSRQYLHHGIITLSNFFIPLAIMTFAYARMYCEFRQHAIRLRKNTTLQADQILGQQIQVTKTLFIVLACFLLCWFPYAAYSTYVSMIEDKNLVPTWANPVAYCFMYMNSGCNPIIYAWRSPSFREGYKEILCQKSAYIVSDDNATMVYCNQRRRESRALSGDTIRETDSPSIIRRFSTLLHASFMSTRTSRCNSDASSINSTYNNTIQRSASNNIHRSASTSSPSHTLLRRATSKTATGSSVIKKDGSLIITKNGKIISVRPDKSYLKRDQSFSGFDLLEKAGTNGIPVSKSVSDVNVVNGERIELTPFLNRGRGINSSCNSISSQNSLSANRSDVHYMTPHHFHASLTKIESVDESDYIQENSKRPESIRSTENNKREMISPLDTDVAYNYSPSIRSDDDDVFVKSPVTVNCNSVEVDLNSMSLKPSIKPNSLISKSDMMLDRSTENEAQSPLLNNNMAATVEKKISKSSDVVFAVPVLRYPSVERLDLPPCQIPRCSSDATAIRKLRSASPLYKRRFMIKRKTSTEKT